MTTARLRLVARLPTERPDIWLQYSPHDDLVVRLDDDEAEAVIVFEVLQAMRLTTRDAYPFTGSEADGLWEVLDSPWLAELARIVRIHDSDADFMEESHHFLVVGYDDVLEVASFKAQVRETRTSQRVQAPSATEPGDLPEDVR